MFGDDVTPIVVALIGAAGTVAAAMVPLWRAIHRGHERNSLEHQDNAARLDSILVATGRIEEKIDSHLDAHRQGTL